MSTPGRQTKRIEQAFRDTRNSFPYHWDAFCIQKNQKMGTMWCLWKGIFWGCVGFFNLQISPVKCSQHWVREKMRLCDGLFIQGSMDLLLDANPCPFLASRGDKAPATLLQEPQSFSGMGCPEALLQRAGFVRQAWNRTIPPASTQTFS